MGWDHRQGEDSRLAFWNFGGEQGVEAVRCACQVLCIDEHFDLVSTETEGNSVWLFEIEDSRCWICHLDFWIPRPVPILKGEGNYWIGRRVAVITSVEHKEVVYVCQSLRHLHLSVTFDRYTILY